MKFPKLLSIVLIFLITATFAHAQDNSAPVIITRLGDPALYAWTSGAATPICDPTGETFNGFPLVLSPDGSHFAFLTTPEIPVEGSADTFMGANNASNIWICDIAAGTATLAAGQPADAVFTPQDPINSTFIIHSSPAWSPDSTRLAWNQVVLPGYSTELVIYDIAVNSAEVVNSRTELSAAYVVPSLDWGEPGIASFDLIRQVDDSVSPLPSLLWYDAAAGQAQTIVLNDIDINDARWVRSGETEVLYIGQSEDNLLNLFDPTTGEVTQLQGDLEYYSLFAPDALRLHTVTMNVSEPQEWVVSGPDFGKSLGVSGNEYAFTLSPDGQQVAFVTFENYPFGGKAYVLTDPIADTYVTIEGVGASYNENGAIYIFWAPMGLRVQAGATLATPAPEATTEPDTA